MVLRIYVYPPITKMEEKRGITGVELLQEIKKKTNKNEVPISNREYELYGADFDVRHVRGNQVWIGIQWDMINSNFAFTCTRDNLIIHGPNGTSIVSYDDDDMLTTLQADISFYLAQEDETDSDPNFNFSDEEGEEASI